MRWKIARSCLLLVCAHFIAIAPAEVLVEVAGGKCNDEKDVLFELTGFRVNGEVSSDKSCKSDSLGVVGATVVLTTASGTTVATAVSQQGGLFSFENIAPGSYKAFVRGDATSRNVDVAWGPTKISEPIVISSASSFILHFISYGTATQQCGFC